MIVSSKQDWLSAISAQLSSNSFLVSAFADANTLLGQLDDSLCDIIVVQFASSNLDPVAFLSRLRERSNAGCIVLAERADLADCIVALESGADDYLDVEVNLRELLARVRAVLRRAQDVGAIAPIGAECLAVPSPDLTFDRVQRRVAKPDGGAIPLTTSEFNLLATLADNANVPLTRDRLYDLVYKRRWSAYDRTLDTLVAKLRRKIEKDPQSPELIKTVHGTGYIFTGMTSL